MSTRGTYCFETRYGTKVYFYIHCNNYPMGAVRYFLNMKNFKENWKSPFHEGDDFAEAFIKSNLRVEFTTCHEQHSDREYQYDMDFKGILTAQHSDGQVFFKGPYIEFIEKYKNLEE